MALAEWCACSIEPDYLRMRGVREAPPLLLGLAKPTPAWAPISPSRLTSSLSARVDSQAYRQSGESGRIRREEGGGSLGHASKQTTTKHICACSMGDPTEGM